MFEKSSHLTRKSSVFFDYLWTISVIFGHFWKMLGKICVAFGQLLDNRRRSSESGRKVFKNVFTYMFKYCGDFIQ